MFIQVLIVFKQMYSLGHHEAMRDFLLVSHLNSIHKIQIEWGSDKLLNNKVKWFELI